VPLPEEVAATAQTPGAVNLTRSPVSSISPQYSSSRMASASSPGRVIRRRFASVCGASQPTSWAWTMPDAREVSGVPSRME
jgi:hypothetical protein